MIIARPTRRQFLGAAAAAPLFAAEARKHKIRDVQTMTLQGARTYVLVKIVSDSGVYGIGEAYGSPAIGVKEQVLGLKQWLIGKDPLEIDTLYTTLGEGGTNLAGSISKSSPGGSIPFTIGTFAALCPRYPR